MKLGRNWKLKSVNKYILSSTQYINLAFKDKHIFLLLKTFNNIKI